ncbi:MAG TPA: ArsA family ATPase [Candidatus Thermoplasmatota archaeon]|nr:ArsA family ATPase [Candidatus Thermoplasmatota archaeon]
MPAPRLSLFLGKGGVGRTTLASAFAVDRAAAGERVLLMGVVSQDEVASRIQHEAAGVDTRGRLELLHVDSRALVDDLVRKVMRMPALSEFILRNPSYESLVDIVPGVREMALFHLIGKKREEGQFDRIVLDAPATGHGIHFLEAPEKTAKILAGPLRARAEDLRAMLKDPAVTDVVIVTLAEEMPVRETMELARKLRDQGFPLDNVVVNRWLPRVFADARSRAVLDRLPADGAGAWLDAMRLMAAQRTEHEQHLAELRALDVKLAVVPLIPESSRRLLKVAQAMKEVAP